MGLTTHAAAREERAERGRKVVEALAQAGINSSYEERSNGPVVELYLDEAESLASHLEDLDGLVAWLHGELVRP